MEYKGLTILFLGDIDISRFYRMKEEEIGLPVEVLILPHHGSRYRMGEEILTWFDPKIVIILGRGPYHPHPEFIKLLEHKDLMHLSTSEKGRSLSFLKINTSWFVRKRGEERYLVLGYFFPYPLLYTSGLV